MPSINFSSIFWFCALLGTGLMAVQFIWMILGADHDHELDPHEMPGSHSDTGDGKFKWGLRQMITASIMMFGWIGLASHHQFNYSLLVSTFIALSGAFFSSLTIRLIFHISQKAHSTGSVFNIEQAVGKEAVVYQRIPEAGSGKISISIHQMTHEINAISLLGEEISSFTKVQVVKTSNETTVVVKTVKK